MVSFSIEGKSLNSLILLTISVTTDSFSISLGKFLIMRRGKRLGILLAEMPKASEYEFICWMALDLSPEDGKCITTLPSLEGTALVKENDKSEAGMVFSIFCRISETSLRLSRPCLFV